MASDTASVVMQAQAMNPELSLSRRWFALAVASLLLAGLFAPVPVTARIPGMLSFWEPNFARRILAVHVNLALVLWFYSFAAALFTAIPGPACGRQKFSFMTGVLAAIGVVSGLLAVTSETVMANYIPLVAHPAFLVSLCAFGGAITLTFLDGRLLGRVTAPSDSVMQTPPILPGSAHVGMRASGLVFLVAVLTFIVAAIVTPRELSNFNYYETIIWGGGHTLQAANACAMMACWLLLCERLGGRQVLSLSWSRVIFGCLIAPWMLSPLLAAMGTDWGIYLARFTRLMQWCLFPAISVMLLVCLVQLLAAGIKGTLVKGIWKDPRFTGFMTSGFLTVLGFVLGAMIQGATVVIPAHYHASIGGVTVAFMAASYELMRHYGFPVVSRTLKAISVVQPIMFGIGQVTFVFGLTLAGLHGIERKVYGAEQGLGAGYDAWGMVIMGVGGGLAITGGVMFVWIVIASWFHARRASAMAHQSKA